MRIKKETLAAAAGKGLLAEGQVEPLWSFLASRSTFNFLYLAYFFGALLIIGAFSVFMVTAWEAYGGAAILALSLVYIAGLTGAGLRLWRQAHLKTPGGLLVTAAVCIVPLALYALQRTLGVWSDDPPGTYREFHQWIRGGWIWMELGTLAAGALALWWIRFPFLTAPLAFVLWYISMDLTPILFGPDYAWENRKWVSLCFGLVMLAGTFLIDRRTREDYAFWGYLFGLLAFWGGLTAMRSDSELGKAVYCLINLLLLALGVLLQRRAFLVFGAIGVFAYLGHLAWEVFEDWLLFPIALSALGMLIIWLAVLAQKHYAAIEARAERLIPAAWKRVLPSQR